MFRLIATNKNNWSERKRFTLCHELAHLVMEVEADIDPEKAAHCFAGAFLMPAETVWAAIGKHRSSISLGELFYMKELFGTSFQAITYRCKDLGIINQTLFKRLFDEFTARGWRSPPFQEPGALSWQCEMPKRLKRLCLRGIAEGVLDKETAARALEKPIEEILSIMENPA